MGQGRQWPGPGQDEDELANREQEDNVNFKKAYPSKWINAGDLDGKAYRVTIRTFESRVDVGGGDFKPVLYFENANKGLILNKTNAATIAEVYGEETDHWTGHAIILYPERVHHKGKPTYGVRIRFPDEPRHPQAPAPAPAGGTFGNGSPEPEPAPSVAEQRPNIDDEIPF